MTNSTPGRWRQYGLPLAMITIGGLVIRFLHFSLALGSDDQVWVTVANEVSADAAHSDEHVYYTRLLWTWLLIAWGSLGSLSLEWTAVLMFALSALTTLFIAAGTRAAFGAHAALLAAAVYAAHPIAVAYDTATLPDGLAVCMLAATFWCFLRYLQVPRRGLLIVAGLLIGLLFGVKNYFMLVSLTCAWALLASVRDWRRWIVPVGILASAAFAGVGIALLLGVASEVDSSSHVTSFGNYVRYISQVPASGADQGLRQLLMLLVERAEGATLLFFGFGALMGTLTLFGFAHSLCESRRMPAHLFLASTAALFLLFLMFMPVRLSPLTFTQLHERYLTVLLPALAISAGAALAGAWAAFGARPLRIAAAAAFVAVIGYSAWIPGEMHDRYGRLELRGLAQVVAEAPAHGTRQLLLPAYLHRIVPTSYRGVGVQLRFVELDSSAGAASALDAVATNPSTAVVAIRAPYRYLTERLRTGDYGESTAYGDYDSLMREARARGFSIEEVRVPYDTARVWLARLGMATRGQLVGWVIRKPAL
jgi:hypothetical protein